jgi:hypothetical protein
MTLVLKYHLLTAMVLAMHCLDSRAWSPIIDYKNRIPSSFKKHNRSFRDSNRPIMIKHDRYMGSKELYLLPERSLSRHHTSYRPKFASKIISLQAANTMELLTQTLGPTVPYNDMTIGVLKETFPGENRVSLTPDSVALLTKAGFHVLVQNGGRYRIHFFQK